ncbi:hypothetical protein KAFR_0G00760 [Kazachstania africana CBS 2517]|uniref:triacylglycerol lipase n=1 Tax=Kazachstania africana (strain ATCC 22294 / BCRC 22015 / CBS 2517 / CECT 1963 / NBRC 1671 / NRRL Y-8276) TaxID=1071382 RepID=H2AXK9_KAZAF|nr:hypothetical protein KAFR_0G00760 [Kazachstania africana CBS 2517]CCF59109.1 hypothetical protein KAFR_0G00760 [Kazachstania africana CBS 2517]
MMVNIFYTLFFCVLLVQGYVVKAKENDLQDLVRTQDILITEPVYERLVYFSKACALCSCIRSNELFEGKTMKDGACPKRLKFCHDEEDNPTVGRTRIEMVLIADVGELGTGYVLVDHGREVVVMVFRSSSTNEDWLSDFKVTPVSYTPVCQEGYMRKIEEGKLKKCENCKLHRGFNKFTKTLSKHFLEKMERILLKYPDYRVVTTGHSLGAALAIISGIELRLRGYEPLVLTYAPPRMFNREMSDWIDDLFETDSIHQNILESGEVKFEHGYFRVVHNSDLIPMLPPMYEVAGLEIFINKLDLPHTRTDIQYVGPGEFKVDNQCFGRIEFLDEVLHTNEHRSYFINLTRCSGF